VLWGERKDKYKVVGVVGVSVRGGWEFVFWWGFWFFFFFFFFFYLRRTS